MYNLSYIRDLFFIVACVLENIVAWIGLYNLRVVVHVSTSAFEQCSLALIQTNNSAIFILCVCLDYKRVSFPLCEDLSHWICFIGM